MTIASVDLRDPFTAHEANDRIHDLTGEARVIASATDQASADASAARSLGHELNCDLIQFSRISLSPK
jgi:hypothetical protein